MRQVKFRSDRPPEYALLLPQPIVNDESSHLTPPGKGRVAEKRAMSPNQKNYKAKTGKKADFIVNALKRPITSWPTQWTGNARKGDPASVIEALTM